jgi:hypothetical protein
VALTADRVIVTEGAERVTGIEADAGAGGTGDAGEVVIRGGTVLLRDGGVISTDTTGPGRGGRVVLDVARLELDGGMALAPLISADAQEGSSGAGGTVAIRGDLVLLERGGQIHADAGGSGRGGTVLVEAGRLVIREGRERFTGIAALARTGTGDGGAISIQANRIEILSGGLIASSSFTGGAAGTIDIDADHLVIEGEGAPTTGIPALGIAGDAGAITIDAGRIVMRDGAVISTTTFGPGAGGRIVVHAGQLLIERAGGPFTGIASAVETDASGAGGEVDIIADEILLRAGGQIRSLTFGSGDAGDIRINADRLRLEGDAPRGLVDIIPPGSIPFGITLTAILSSAEPIVSGGMPIFPEGGAGQLTIDAGEIAIVDGALISSSSFSPTEPAGDVAISADRLEIHGGAILTGAPFAGGGRITLIVDRLIDLEDSWITTAVGGGETTSAGDITIDPPILILDDSLLLANAAAGRGGNITITVDQLIRSPDSRIDASAGPAGIDGTVVISSPDADVAGGLVVLEASVLGAAALLRERCAARRDVGASSFTGVGRGGLRLGPDGPLASAYPDRITATDGDLTPNDSHPAEAPRSAAIVLSCASSSQRRIISAAAP